MYHFRKTRHKYKSFPKPDHCHFCDTKEMTEIIEETAFARVVRNRVSYDMWEMRRVTDHLMVIPKRHVRSLNELTDSERLDIMKLLGRYEANHYNVYARSVESIGRSIAHQHTHLIRTENKASKALLFLRKPYLLIKL
jgi:diadenosine tetraphosphate (Ap4A) HIT family hydrolase